MSAIEDPLLDPPPAEVPLENAPLLRVIAQVRFPPILSIEERGFVAPFQEAIRAAYPVLRQERIQGMLVGPAGMAQVKPEIAWRFSDAEGIWRASLTSEFLALETSSYTSRADFLGRFHALVAALDVHVQPKRVDRLGVRYVDRIAGADVDEITRLVRSEVRGLAGTQAGSHAVQALSETLFEVDGARLMARWGWLPPDRSVDISAIEAASEKSWLLDLDMFSVRSSTFDVERILEDSRRYASRIYAFFRWVVTDDFLRRYGGKP